VENTFASILTMKGRFVGEEVHDQKDVIFTGKDASDIRANKMAV
jgi:hypothetical protein